VEGVFGPERRKDRTRAALFVALAALGCGPSFQAVHEGEARFEHCYAMDESASAALERKAACWHDWVSHYTYGQTRDRVSYAAQRYRALSAVPDLPTDEAMMSAAPGEGVTGSTIAAPAPTSAFAPPPKTLEERDAGASTAPSTQVNAPSTGSLKAVDAGGVGRPAAAMCADTCEGDWSKCRAGCSGKACDACDKPYKSCLARCVK